MESRRDMYKQRRRGIDRDGRAQATRDVQKARREQALAKRRSMVLTQLQEEVEQVSKKPSATDRLERLREWQKQRDEKKRLQNEQKNKKAFVVGRKPTVGTRAVNTSSKPSFVFGIGKSTSQEAPPQLHARPKPSQKPVNKPVQSSKLATTINAATSKSKSVPQPLSKPASVASKKVPAVKPSPPGPSGVRKGTKKRSPVVTRTSTRIARRTESGSAGKTAGPSSRQKKPNSKPGPAVSASRPNTREKGTGRFTNAAKPSNVCPGGGSKAGKKAGSAGKKPARKPVKQVAPEEEDKKDKVNGVLLDYLPPETDPIVSSDLSSENEPEDPPAPEVLPSAPRGFPPGVILVNDPAWIPGARPKTPKTRNAPNFDEAFGVSPFHSFSPFLFTGRTNPKPPSNQLFQFTFKKNLIESANLHTEVSTGICNISSDSLAESVGELDVKPRNGRMSLSERHRSRSYIGSSAGKVVEDTPDVLMIGLDNPPQAPALSADPETKGGEMDEEMMETESMDSKEDGGGIDFAYFHGLHSGVTEQLTSICDQWEGKVAGLEQEQVDGEGGVSEDVIGQIRTAIGQGRLLMRKKMKQYLGLVEGAESPQDGERKTTADDLQGFWDLVYFQVEDVYRKFTDLTQLEANGWKENIPKPKKKVKKRTATSTKPTDTASGCSERQQAAREKREAARSRLRELKAAAAAKRAREEEDAASESTPDSDLMMFASPSKKIKPDQTAPSPIIRSSSRQRSAPSRYSPSPRTLVGSDDSDHAQSSSGFSPPRRNPTEMEGGSCQVPTGTLVSLTPGKALESPFKVPCSPLRQGSSSSTKYVSLNFSKKVRDLMGVDVIMSPVRRSTRLAERGVHCTSESLAVSSLREIPGNLEYGYRPNPGLM